MFSFNGLGHDSDRSLRQMLSSPKGDVLFSEGTIEIKGTYIDPEGWIGDLEAFFNSHPEILTKLKAIEIQFQKGETGEPFLIRAHYSSPAPRVEVSGNVPTEISTAAIGIMSELISVNT